MLTKKRNPPSFVSSQKEEKQELGALVNIWYFPCYKCPDTEFIKRVEGGSELLLTLETKSSMEVPISKIQMV
jgi:hypothetical protein